MKKTHKIGIDVGGVIMGGGNATKTGADTSFFGPNYLLTPAIKGCFDALRQITAQFGERNVVIVSKAGPTTRVKTLEWFRYYDFYNLTNIHPDDVHFCARRPDKAPIAEQLNLTHFVDDRLEVLGYLTTVPHRYLFCPSSNEVEKHASHLKTVKVVDSWAELLGALK